jgi:uncharacterized Zn finger protein
MQLIKLTEDQLRNICEPMNFQRSENYIGRFYDCELKDNVLSGKVRGNHGVYNVELKIDTDPLQYKCDCRTSKKMFCKHAAALGLTYIYTPWVFITDIHISRDEVNNLEDLNLYLKNVKLKTLIEELKEKEIGIAKLVELLGISVQQLSGVMRDDMNGKFHILTIPLKLACLYLIEKNFN